MGQEEAVTFGSLFAGVGGFDLGFERAGMQCEWQVEIDDYATRVLERHWPNVRRWRDVRTFPTEPIEQWRVDVICGGFPCQDISYAGRGAGLAGERSGLFFEAIRVVQQLQPRYVCLENVAALLSRGLDVVLGTLAEIGYDAEWHCLPAAAFGAPHIRDRVFIIAADASCIRCDTRGTKQPLSGIGTYRKVSNPICQGLEIFSCEPSDYEKEQPTTERNHNGWQWWETEPDVGRVANGVPARTHRLRCLGNAVCPPVAEWVGRRIMKYAEDHEP